MAVMARPSIYERDKAHEICERLAAGETLRQICQTPGMPAEATVRLWALDNRDGFAELYGRARNIGLDCIGDGMIDIADDGTNDWMETEHGEQPDHEHINRSRLRIDTRKWLLSKLRPDKYGDRITQEHTGPGGEALTVNLHVNGVKPKT